MISATIPARRNGQTWQHDVRAVLREMDDCNDDHRRYVRTLASDLDMPVERLRQVLRHLGEQGLATYGPVRDGDEGRPAGSTWWLTLTGIALREEIGGRA